MKTVKWLSPSRIVPNYGVAEPGKEIGLPDALADGFVAQGEAELVDVKRAPKRAELKESKDD